MVKPKKELIDAANKHAFVVDESGQISKTTIPIRYTAGKPRRNRYVLLKKTGQLARFIRDLQNNTSELELPHNNVITVPNNEFETPKLKNDTELEQLMTEAWVQLQNLRSRAYYAQAAKWQRKGKSGTLLAVNDPLRLRHSFVDVACGH